MRVWLSKTAAAALVAAAAFAGPAHAQRMSLAERVSALEAQQQNHGGSGSVDLVNQINALQSQVQSLQGQVEELRHQLDEMKNRSKEQYIDLDSRIGRLEGRNPTGAAPPPSNINPNNGNLPDMNLSGAQA